jgi:hypothetical protein
MQAGNMETIDFEGADISVGKLKEKVADQKQIDTREIELSCATTSKVPPPPPASRPRMPPPTRI